MTTILLVEDNEMNRDMLTRRLLRRGYEVITADNGATAVEKALDEKPDLILMDMELPIKDGWTATTELKRQHQQTMPILALTAHALSGDRERAYEAGCDGYATKPIDFPLLLDLIQEHLEP